MADMVTCKKKSIYNLICNIILLVTYFLLLSYMIPNSLK